MLNCPPPPLPLPSFVSQLRFWYDFGWCYIMGVIVGRVVNVACWDWEGGGGGGIVWMISFLFVWPDHEKPSVIFLFV